MSTPLEHYLDRVPNLSIESIHVSFNNDAERVAKRDGLILALMLETVVVVETPARVFQIDPEKVLDTVELFR